MEYSVMKESNIGTGNYQIEVTMEGLPEDNGDARLDVFCKQLQLLDNILKKLDQYISNGEKTTQFRVIDLSHSSPARISIRPFVVSHKTDNRKLITNSFISAFQEIENGNIPDFLNVTILEDLEKFASPVGKTLSAIGIKVNQREINVNPIVVSVIKKYLSNADSCLTSYEGILEIIDIHRGKNIFRIFPVSMSQSIKCHFSNELLFEAKKAIGCKVSIEGIAKYATHENFPFEIEVSNIQIYPQEDELPKVQDLKGIAKDATDNLTSEEFVARNRDEWE